MEWSTLLSARRMRESSRKPADFRSEFEIISGKGEEPKSLEPQGNTNRAECATIISRYTNLK